MNNAVEQILKEFEERSKREWDEMGRMSTAEWQSQLDRFLLSVGPATGQLMNLLVKEAKAKSVLEVGSSFGYSTVWLAEAVRESGGVVTSLEIHPEKQNHARDSIERAGLRGFVDFKLGDARESLRTMKQTVDFVLLDLWNDLYIPCFDLFYPKLNPGALIVADNMIFPESYREDAAAYQKHIRTKPGIQSLLLPVGFGLELSRYR